MLGTGWRTAGPAGGGRRARLRSGRRLTRSSLGLVWSSRSTAGNGPHGRRGRGSSTSGRCGPASSHAGLTDPPGVDHAEPVDPARDRSDRSAHQEPSEQRAARSHPARATCRPAPAHPADRALVRRSAQPSPSEPRRNAEVAALSSGSALASVRLRSPSRSRSDTFGLAGGGGSHTGTGGAGWTAGTGRFHDCAGVPGRRWPFGAHWAGAPGPWVPGADRLLGSFGLVELFGAFTLLGVWGRTVGGSLRALTGGCGRGPDAPPCGVGLGAGLPGRLLARRGGRPRRCGGGLPRCRQVLTPPLDEVRTTILLAVRRSSTVRAGHALGLIGRLTGAFVAPRRFTHCRPPGPPRRPAQHRRVRRCYLSQTPLLDQTEPLRQVLPLLQLSRD